MLSAMSKSREDRIPTLSLAFSQTNKTLGYCLREQKCMTRRLKFQRVFFLFEDFPFLDAIYFYILLNIFS